jgi:hypothetical protein
MTRVFEAVFERVAGLDVHKAQVTACVRVEADGRRVAHLAEFATTVVGLLALADWLKATRSRMWRWRPPACSGCLSGTSSRMILS